MSGPVVLLLRERARGADPYEIAFRESGLFPIFEPVLSFSFENDQTLAAQLQKAEEYGGLIITSPRAASALLRQDVHLPQWSDSPTYVVGPATKEVLAGTCLRLIGEASGRAEVLAPVIVATASDRPLLFLCGNRRRSTIPDALESAGVAFEELVVYHTEIIPPTSLPPHPAWTVFFSPSGVEAATMAAGFPWNRTRIAAIGPTTAEALVAAGHPPEVVAADPTPDALVRAVTGATSL